MTRARLGLTVDPDEVLEGFKELEPFPDAAEAIPSARGAAVLTNGGAKDTAELLSHGGIEISVFSVEDVRALKPSPLPYRHVAEQLGERPVFVAAHACGVLGARSAGFEAVWVDRSEHEWPFPDRWMGLQASTLTEAAELARHSSSPPARQRRG